MKNSLEHLNDLQKAELDILKSFISICQKYQLKYFLCGGSLLGAVRHKGFIPWDDDIDIAMPRPDYIRFKQIAATELPASIYLSTFDTLGHVWLVPMLINKNTKFILNNAEEKKEVGAWMDILIIDGAPSKQISRFFFGIKYLCIRMLYQLANFSKVVNLNKKRPLHEKIIIKFAQLSHIEKILNPKIIAHWYDKIVQTYDYSNCNYVATFSGAAKMHEIVPKSYYGDGSQYSYEDITVIGCSDYDNYLKHFYNNYMEFPPQNERNRHNVTKVCR